MEGMTGLEVAIAVRARVPSCEILLISGNFLKAEELRERSGGGRRFEILAKPLHPLDLLAGLLSLIRLFRNEGAGT